jgi:GNAT superfamily N-acetyltransferase
MRLAELSEGDARAIARWHYPPPYDCYDSPAWEQMEREGWAICDDETRHTEFLALRPDVTDAGDPEDALAGYVRFRPAADSLALHLALRPDLCGQGLGRAFLDLVLPEARRRAAGLPLTLQVRRFNSRAIAAYRRAGFRMVVDDSEGDPQERLTMFLTD